MNTKMCPCCGKHCYMDELKCGNGVQFRDTGIMPEKKHKHEHTGELSEEQKLMMERRKHYHSLSLEGKLDWSFHNISDAILKMHENENFKVEDTFKCLREEDKEYLLLIFEKLRHSWHKKL